MTGYSRGLGAGTWVPGDDQEFDDTGLVLAKGIFREYDVWLRVLFEQHGVQRLSAFGGLHSRKRFVGCLDVLNIIGCRVRVKRRSGYMDLLEAQLVQGPGYIRAVPGRQGIGMNCVKLLDAAWIPPEAAADCFRLARETLTLLNDPACEIGLLPLFFRLKLMANLGYVPDFLHCGLCRAELLESTYVSVEEGCPVCARCREIFRRRSTGAIFEPATLVFLQQVRDSWPLDWQAQNLLHNNRLEAEQRRCASRTLDGILRYHVGLVWEQGRFLHV